MAETYGAGLTLSVNLDGIRPSLSFSHTHMHAHSELVDLKGKC